MSNLSSLLAFGLGTVLALAALTACNKDNPNFCEGTAEECMGIDAPIDSPPRRVADAMRAHPELMSGTNRDDALLIRSVPGLLSKGGAEGVIAAALPGVGAVAVKIDDGAARARGPVLIAALRWLGMAVDGLADLADLAQTPVIGGGRPVGAVRVGPDVFLGERRA